MEELKEKDNTWDKLESLYNLGKTTEQIEKSPVSIRDRPQKFRTINHED